MQEHAMKTPPKVPAAPIPAAQTRARREALAAAERSGIREGLPPVSEFARDVGERYAKGELTGEQGVAEIIKHHRTRSGN